jgi:hypothetical protein
MKALGIIAIVLLCGAVFVGIEMRAMPGEYSSALAASSGLQWHLHDDPGPIGEPATWSATATQPIERGGSVAMEAICDDHTIGLEFEYHASRDDDAHSRFEMRAGGTVHIMYRADNGDIHEAVSQNNHPNTADVMFTYDMSDADQNGAAQEPGALVAAATAAFFPGLAPQDLRTFLHAQENRFELPLGNGSKAVIVINPRDRRFEELVMACKISLKRFDADSAKQRAADHAAAQATSDEQAKAEARQSEQSTALQTHITALTQACTNGNVALRVNSGPVNLEDAQNAASVWVFGGQSVQAVADPEAAAHGKCTVEFMQGNRDVTGKLPMGSLDVADSGATPAPNP